MTAALGFRCIDGVVLAADTEMTGVSTKWPERKIIGFPKLKTKPHFAYSTDNVAFAKNVIERLATQIKNAEHSGSDILTALRADLKKIHKEYCRLFPQKDERPSAEILLAIRNPHQVLLYVIKGVELNRVHKDEYIGIGEPIVRTVASPFFQSTLTTEDAARLAVYSLMHAKESGAFVGKRSDVLMIDHRETMVSERWYGEEYVKEMEEDFEVFRTALSPVLMAYNFSFPDSKKDETFEKSLKAFVSTIKKRRKRHIREFWKELEQDIKKQREEEEKSRTTSP